MLSAAVQVSSFSLCFTACPDRLQFFYPYIYLLMGLSNESKTERLYNEKRFELDKPGETRLIVKVPPADPPVTCSVVANQLTVPQDCSGLKDKEKDCEYDIFVRSLIRVNVIVRMSFLGLDTSITTFHVNVKGKKTIN